MKSRGVFLLTFIYLLSFNSFALDKKYQDTSLPVSERVENLLKQMTWEEKLAQTWCIHLYDDMVDEQWNLTFEDEYEGVLSTGIGQLGKPSWAFDKEPEESAEIANRIQKQVIAGNRFGIPVIFHEEGLHGLWARGSTVFPQAIGMSCSWDPQLVEKVFKVISKEIRSRGSHQANTPMLDVCRDPRWGRIEESYGEDPYLTSKFGVAIVKGLQGMDKTIGKDHIVATVKHFCGYGLTEGGLNKTPLYVSERYLREVVLPPFKAAIMEGGALSLMPAYNEIDGIPCHANKWLLTDLIRGEWDFEGYVVSDYGGVVQLSGFHPVTDNRAEAGELAMMAGVDMELDNPYYFSELLESVKKNSELQAALNQAVRRILGVKFKLGLFDDPYINPKTAGKINRNQKHLALSLKAAEESIVLLKNKEDILPLNPKKYKKIAVIGPHANHMHFGGYAHKDTRHGITILEGIKQYVKGKTEILYAEGCRIHEGSGHWLDGPDDFDLTDPEVNERKILEAVEIAEQCDLVILAVGGTAVTCGEFIGYRHELDLFGQQNELVDGILDTGVPTVVCLVNGRPLTINTIDEEADAVVEAWYPGEQAGIALAKILFGEVNPSGKLTLSFPKHVGHLPVYYSKKSTATHDYLAEETSPLYPFGYGLSYTDFEYADLTIKQNEINEGGYVELSFNLKNIGKFEAEEIVQLYIRDMVSSVTRPIKELKGFQKVGLKPGRTETVKFKLSTDDLKFYNQQMAYVVEPGEFKIMIGASSEDIRLEGMISVVQ